MIVLIGASASGKTEIAKILIKQGYKKCITTTTRSKRPEEVDGVDYHFVSRKGFNELLLQNAFIEVTQYQDSLYGLQRKDIQKEGLVIVDPNGANNIIKAMGSQVFVCFVSSSKKHRKQRMQKRKDSLTSMTSRLSSDDTVFKKRNLYKVDLVLKNKNQPLKELANTIDQTYQIYKKQL